MSREPKNSRDTVYNCIVQRINNRMSIIYSFKDGKFYLVYNAILPMRLQNIKIEKMFVDLSECEFHTILNSALNPKTIDINEFNSPIVVGLMVSNKCNLKCRYCIARNGKGYSGKNILLNDFNMLIQKLVDSQIISILISGGEPTLNENLLPFLKQLSKHVFLMMIDTNGIVQSEELVEIYKMGKIVPRISVDSLDEAIHNSNRGELKKTLSNINYLLENKVNVRINTVLHNENAEDLKDLAMWMAKKGIKKWHIFKLQKEFAPEKIWINDEYAKSIVDELILNFSNEINILCKFSANNDGYSSFVIDSEGYCFSTNNSRGKKVIFGNVFREPISEIWRRTPDDYKLRHYNKHLSYKGKKG